MKNNDLSQTVVKDASFQKVNEVMQNNFETRFKMIQGSKKQDEIKIKPETQEIINNNIVDMLHKNGLTK